MTEFRILRDAGAAEPFVHMTFPAYRGLLGAAPAGPRPFVATEPTEPTAGAPTPLAPTPLAIGALERGAPVALALASLAGDGASAKLLSLFVAGPRRRAGLGTALVERVEAECAARGIARLEAAYMSGQPATPAVERIFARTGWSAPRLRMLVVRCPIELLQKLPWLNRFSLPPDTDFLPWVDINAQAREEIRTSHARAPWIAKDLSPFDHEQDAEPVTSLALRVDGKVAGWCLNHRVEGLLRITCSFMRDDLGRRARSLILWSEVVNRMPRIGATTCMWTVPAWRADMVRFTRKRFQPYASFFGETLGVERLLDTQIARLGA